MILGVQQQPAAIVMHMLCRQALYTSSLELEGDNWSLREESQEVNVCCTLEGVVDTAFNHFGGGFPLIRTRLTPLKAPGVEDPARIAEGSLAFRARWYSFMDGE